MKLLYQWQEAKCIMRFNVCRWTVAEESTLGHLRKENGHRIDRASLRRVAELVVGQNVIAVGEEITVEQPVQHSELQEDVQEGEQFADQKSVGNDSSLVTW